jgi:hypothetical protein
MEAPPLPMSAKFQTNKDFRTGPTTSINHTGAFNFRLYQDLTRPEGTYDLSVYAMGESEFENHRIVIITL